jgi:proline iminopeptidase
MGDELLDYRVIYADQRGAGRSPAEDGTLSVEALGNDVLSILDALEVPKATLLAHGFGAMVAAATFARAPERTERLVLVNPWVDMPALAASLQREAARLAGDDEPRSDSDEQPQSGLSPAEIVAQAGREVGGKRLFDALLFSKTSSRLRLEHADAEGFANLQSGAPGADENDDLWSLRADLTPLQQRPVPTAVFVGQQDKSCYPAQAERVLSALPHALFSLLESAHYPWLDDPETFTDLLQQALKLPAE